MNGVKALYVIGIDEVGRGSLAGPVVVCALAMPARLSLRGGPRGTTRQSHTIPLRDSKKLSASQREKWAAWAKAHLRIRYALARVYPRGIERMNISQAANLAATRACARVANRLSLTANRMNVFLDGGLYLRVPRVPCHVSHIACRTIVKGDEKYTAVKLASIVAKVARDKFMKKLHTRYPQYGFAIHKGYGTKQHITAIKKFGPSGMHRVTFIKSFLK